MQHWMMKLSLALGLAVALLSSPSVRADAADPATPAVQSFYATLLD